MEKIINKKTFNLEFNLTLQQEKELEKAIEETYNKDNLMSHEEALKGLSRWLKK